MANYLGFEPVEIKPYYFISYDTADKERVSEYVTAMNAKGLPMWYDHGIHAGSQWESVIAEHLVGCESIILFFSKCIFLKEDSYVRKEFNLATAYGKKIIVVLLDEISQTEVPIKYALWWSAVCDLQCIPAYTCVDIGECVGKVLDGLEVKVSNGKLSVATKKTSGRKASTPEERAAKKIVKCLKAIPRKFTKEELAEESKLDLVEKEWRIILDKLKEEGAVATFGNLIWSTLYTEEEIKEYADSVKEYVMIFMNEKMRRYSEDAVFAAMPNELPETYKRHIVAELLRDGKLLENNGKYCLPTFDINTCLRESFLEAINALETWAAASSLCDDEFNDVDLRKKTAILNQMEKEGLIAAKAENGTYLYCSLSVMEKEKKSVYYSLVRKFKTRKTSAGFVDLLADFKLLGNYKDSADYISKCYEKIEEYKRAEAETTYELLVKKFDSCTTIKAVTDIKREFERFGDYKDSADYISKCCEKIEEYKRAEAEKTYELLVKKFDSCTTIKAVTDIKRGFERFGDYKDSAEYAKKCDKKIDDIRRENAYNAAYNAYLKKYPLMKIKEEIERYYARDKKSYVVNLLGSICMVVITLFFFVLAFFLWDDMSLLVSLFYILFFVFIPGALFIPFAVNFIDAKESIEAYRELQKIPPFEWKGEEEK